MVDSMARSKPKVSHLAIVEESNVKQPNVLNNTTILPSAYSPERRAALM